MNENAKKLTVIHPFLFSIFFTVFLFSHNVELVSLDEVIVPAGVTLLFTLYLWSVLTFLTKDDVKAGLGATLFLLWFFSYGHFYNLKTLSLGHHIALLLGWSVLFTCLYLSIKSKRALYNLTTVLNLVASFLVVINLVNIGIYELKRELRAKKSDRIAQTAEANPASNSFPDIYYIILDRYASFGTLKELFNFDNDEFAEYLTSKHFYVARQSQTNYPQTFLALASSLNMKHLTYLTDLVGNDASDKMVVYEIVEDNEVVRFLKSKGYKFINIGSWWKPTRTNRCANINFNSASSNQFLLVLLQSTVIYPILTKTEYIPYYEFQCKRYREEVLYQFEKLMEMPGVKGPKFVFAHLLTPHEPFVFGPNGEAITKQEQESKHAKELYLNQLIFANKKMMRVIDRILSNSERPPIIILQSDEGPYLHEEFKGKEGHEVDWRALSKEALKSHMEILNTYYLPDVDKTGMYPSITPVNTFRLILNLYFGTNYEPLSDDVYIFEDTKHPYRFINATDKVKGDG